MPRRRIRGKVRGRGLTATQREWLMWGGYTGADSVFPGGDAEAREAWARNRDMLLREYQARRPAGVPRAFWRYEPGVPDALRDEHALADEYGPGTRPELESVAGGHAANIWSYGEVRRRREAWITAHPPLGASDQ